MTLILWNGMYKAFLTQLKIAEYFPSSKKLESNYCCTEIYKTFSSAMCGVSFLLKRQNRFSSHFTMKVVYSRSRFPGVHLDIGFEICSSSLLPVNCLLCLFWNTLANVINRQSFSYFRCITDHSQVDLFYNLNLQMSDEKEAYIYESNCVPLTLGRQIPCRRNNLG